MLTKKSKGLHATGIAAVSCARHQLFRPLGVGDLQKGERYVTSSYQIHWSLTQNFTDNVTWTTFSHQALQEHSDFVCSPYPTMWAVNGSPTSGAGCLYYPSIYTSLSLYQRSEPLSQNSISRVMKRSATAHSHSTSSKVQGGQRARV